MTTARSRLNTLETTARKNCDLCSQKTVYTETSSADAELKAYSDKNNCNSEKISSDSKSEVIIISSTSLLAAAAILVLVVVVVVVVVIVVVVVVVVVVEVED